MAENRLPGPGHGLTSNDITGCDPPQKNTHGRVTRLSGGSQCLAWVKGQRQGRCTELRNVECSPGRLTLLSHLPLLTDPQHLECFLLCAQGDPLDVQLQ